MSDWRRQVITSGCLVPEGRERGRLGLTGLGMFFLFILEFSFQPLRNTSFLKKKTFKEKYILNNRNRLNFFLINGTD